MILKISFAAAALFYLAGTAQAQSIGSASGSGVVQRFIPGDANGATEQVPFRPHYSYAYSEGSPGKESLWIVLTDKEPPVKVLLQSANREEARLSWSEKNKAPFVAVKLDSRSAVDLYYLSAGDGGMNTEMVSTANGLDSVIVKFESRTDSALKGTLLGGDGSCPGADGVNQYCTKRSDYKFEAPIFK